MEYIHLLLYINPYALYKIKNKNNHKHTHTHKFQPKYTMSGEISKIKNEIAEKYALSTGKESQISKGWQNLVTNVNLQRKKAQSDSNSIENKNPEIYQQNWRDLFSSNVEILPNPIQNRINLRVCNNCNKPLTPTAIQKHVAFCNNPKQYLETKILKASNNINNKKDIKQEQPISPVKDNTAKEKSVKPNGKRKLEDDVALDSPSTPSKQGSPGPKRRRNNNNTKSESQAQTPQPEAMDSVESSAPSSAPTKQQAKISKQMEKKQKLAKKQEERALQKRLKQEERVKQQQLKKHQRLKTQQEKALKLQLKQQQQQLLLEKQQPKKLTAEEETHNVLSGISRSYPLPLENCVLSSTRLKTKNFRLRQMFSKCFNTKQGFTKPGFGALEGRLGYVDVERPNEYAFKIDFSHSKYTPAQQQQMLMQQQQQQLLNQQQILHQQQQQQQQQQMSALSPQQVLAQQQKKMAQQGPAANAMPQNTNPQQILMLQQQQQKLQHQQNQQQQPNQQPPDPLIFQKMQQQRMKQQQAQMQALQKQQSSQNTNSGVNTNLNLNLNGPVQAGLVPTPQQQRAQEAAMHLAASTQMRQNQNTHLQGASLNGNFATNNNGNNVPAGTPKSTPTMNNGITTPVAAPNSATGGVQQGLGSAVNIGITSPFQPNR